MRRLLLPIVLLAGCGGGSAEPPAARAPALGFPPTAFEPATAPPTGAEPAGRVVQVGARPEGVAADPETGLVGVAVEDGPALVLVDGRTGAVTGRAPLPSGARHVALAAPGGPFLVPAEDADQLVEVSLPGGGTRATDVGDNPHDATFAGGRSYVADEFSSTLSVVADGEVVERVPVDVQPGGVAVVGDQVALVSVRAYTIELYERTDPLGPGSGSQNVGYGPSHLVADGDGRAYVADTKGGAISVLRTRPRLKFVGRTPVGPSPYGLALDRRRGRLYVTLSGRNELKVLALGDQPRVLKTLPTVRQPNTVAVDERTGRVFVASRAAGTLQIIDP